jgi:hypothetical protein
VKSFTRLFASCSFFRIAVRRPFSAFVTQTQQALVPSELLALQAGVYRYSEAVDLASKLIDKTSNGVKTIISGGGQ